MAEFEGTEQHPVEKQRLDFFFFNDDSSPPNVNFSFQAHLCKKANFIPKRR